MSTRLSDSLVVALLGVSIFVLFRVRLLDLISFACLLVHLSACACAGLCLRVRAFMRVFAGWALHKQKTYFSRCGRRATKWLLLLCGFVT